MRLVIEGGPYLSREETVRVLDTFVPANLVDDVLVDGESWNAKASEQNPDVTMHTSASTET